MTSDDCLAGGGETGALMRAIDWSKTPLGSVPAWPACLRAMVSVMLSSQFPMRIVWGEQLILLYNDAYSPILGSKHPTAMGQRTPESYAEVWGVVGPLIARVMQGESVSAEDMELPLDRNGYLEECYFSFAYSPIRNDAGAPMGVFGVVTETTGRVLAQRRLTTLRELAGTMADAKTVEDVWEGAARVFEASEDIPSSRFISPDGGVVAQHGSETEKSVTFSLARAAHAPFGSVVLGVNPRRALDDHYSAFFDLAVEHIYAATSHVYALEQKQLLAERERMRMHTFLMEAPAAIAVMRGRNHVFELVNSRFYELVGKRELVGVPGREAMPELESQGVWALLDDVFVTGRPFVSDEFEALLDRRSTGTLERGYFSVICKPTHDETGRIDGVMAFAVEVTAQVDVRHGMEAANRAKDEFLAMLGHELRNPLAPIVTALHLMRMGNDDASNKGRAVIERQVIHLTRLVDDLLDVSRITRGKVELERRSVDLAEMVATALEMTSPLLEQRKHKVEVEVPPGLVVHGDPTRLSQVIGNLLNNAAKYTPMDGRIRVHAERQASTLVLTVKDNGTGIAAEVLPRVFDMFVQERQALDRAQGGLGLGLSIVRSMVELHGGQVFASSGGRGKGSTFTVRLPAHQVSQVQDDVQAPLMLHDNKDGKRILIVDDNVDAAELLAESLSLFGYVTRVAHDGPAAIAMAREFSPHVAVLDIGLPVMDGYELARHLRGGDLRLVAVTGYGQDGDRAKAQEAGFLAHLVKPVDLPTLQATIENL